MIYEKDNKKMFALFIPIDVVVFNLYFHTKKQSTFKSRNSFFSYCNYYQFLSAVEKKYEHLMTSYRICFSV